MNKKIFTNPFGIRIKTTTTEKIVLGLIPLMIVLAIWVITTTGRSEIIRLPQGTFGDAKEKLTAGKVFTKNEKVFLEGWELLFETESHSIDTLNEKYGLEYPQKIKRIITNWELHKTTPKDIDMTYIVRDGVKFLITGLPARKFGDGVRINLPAGKVVNIFSPKVATDTQNVQASVTSSLSAPEVYYKYEVVETRIFAPVILPSPIEVFRSLPSLWSQRNLPLNILYSFLRVGAGFLVALMIVFPMSLFMGIFSKFNDLLAPGMLFGGYLPIPALVPLTMCLFGTTETQKIMFLALGFAIYLLPLFVKALEDVDNVYLQTGYTLGATKFQTLSKIIFPIAMPNMYEAMRLGFGIGWGYIILAEMVDMGSKGVGTLILTSQRIGPREDIYLVLIAIVVMAFITDKIWDKVGKELFPYRNRER